MDTPTGRDTFQKHQGTWLGKKLNQIYVQPVAISKMFKDVRGNDLIDFQLLKFLSEAENKFMIQQFQFLGDKWIRYIVTKLLVELKLSNDEGELSKTRGNLLSPKKISSATEKAFPDFFNPFQNILTDQIKMNIAKQYMGAIAATYLATYKAHIENMFRIGFYMVLQFVKIMYKEELFYNEGRILSRTKVNLTKNKNKNSGTKDDTKEQFI
ncbi:hypothetical protein DAMA08_026850 [Martiniozyma asiatica (nom. inval.)]|nr:hypothetical protein DAMA08_026850 [Martiniozyma asiatica]